MYIKCAKLNPMYTNHMESKDVKSIHNRELDELLNFLDTHLRPSTKWSLKDEYPTVFTEKNVHNLNIIEDQGKIVSHAALKPLLTKSPYGNFKIGAIGSVVTDPVNRMKGHSRKVLEKTVQDAEKQDCDMVILWSNLFDFYKKLDFHLSGFEYSAILNDPLNVPAPKDPLTVKTGPNVCADTLLKLYNQHTVTQIRTKQEIQSYLKIPNAKIYTAWDSHSKLKAYAVMGKGMDLQNYIHEWAGDKTSLLHLISKIKEEHANQQLVCLIPNHSHSLIKELVQREVPLVEGSLGLIKILKPEKLVNVFNNRVNVRFPDAHIKIVKSGKYYTLQAGEASFELASNEQLSSILFGKINQPQIFNAVKSLGVSPLDLPLEMWIWGWDSV
jgi:hypothetical protein